MMKSGRVAPGSEAAAYIRSCRLCNTDADPDFVAALAVAEDRGSDDATGRSCDVSSKRLVRV